ncbi:MAG: N-acetyltransferase [Candidatus Lokiarchaeota archaeon]|nr:N-acetyltransferase [Candidatus Lokiarchaeota archaeon]
MVLSEEITHPNETFKYHMRDLQEQDAEEMAHIFTIVYAGQYPLKEYEDPDWIRQQVNNPNIIWKVCADSNERPVGCGVMLLNAKHGRIYGGRTVLLPELQDKGVMNKIGMKCMMEVMMETKDRVRMWFGQSRTEPDNIAMQRALEKAGFRPIALMVDMDTGTGDRESELVQTLIWNETFTNRRTDVKLVPEVKSFYEISRKQYVKMGKEYDIIDVPKIERKDCDLTFTFTPGKYYHTFTITNTVASISTTINPFTESLTIDEFTQGHPDVLYFLLEELLMFCAKRNIKFIEACISAYEPEEQRLFLDHGFKIAGYFPAHDLVAGKGEDRIIMVKIPDQIMTTGFEFTKTSWKVAKIILNHLGLQGGIDISERGNVQFFVK